MDDDYTHIVSNAFYIVENIMGPEEDSLEYMELYKNFNSQITDRCVCVTTCSSALCDCLHKSGGENYVLYQDSDKYILNPQKEVDPVLECSDFCNCSKYCSNRVVQNGPIKGLEIKSCEKGFGLYTTKSITKGTFVCEYAGELITKTQAAARHKANQEQKKMNYIFRLNEHSNGKIVEYFVDPSNFGNIGRYLNHSCSPNCHIVPVRCGCPIPKLAIFACKDISVNEELTFDYGSKNMNDVQNDSLQRTKCLCKSEGCRGFMPFQYS